MTNDKRDPQQLGKSIITMRRESGLPVTEVADMLDQAAGFVIPSGRNTLEATRAGAAGVTSGEEIARQNGAQGDRPRKPA